MRTTRRGFACGFGRLEAGNGSRTGKCERSPSGRSPVGVAARLSRLRVICVLVASIAAALTLGAPSASAESFCTDTWTGPSEGSWTTAGDWSSGVPTSTSVACIGSGKKVTVSSGSNFAGVVQGEGTLLISGGSLEVSNTLEASTIGSLTLTGATLTGAASIYVSSSVEWSSGTMSGSGTTIVQSGASGTIKSNALLSQRVLKNEGTLTIPESNRMKESEGAELENIGTFKVNTGDENAIEKGSGTAPSVVNTGTFEKTENSGSPTIQVAFENHGVAKATVGSLVFTGGGSANSAGEWEGSGSASVAFKTIAYTVDGGNMAGNITINNTGKVNVGADEPS
jgi:hypothetical protein